MCTLNVVAESIMLTGISVLLGHTFIKKHEDLVNSNYVYFVANAPDAPDGWKLADLGRWRLGAAPAPGDGGTGDGERPWSGPFRRGRAVWPLTTVIRRSRG